MTNFLYEITQPSDANFQLTLADNSILDCQRVVRVIAQKRLVCQAIWQGKAVYVKLFLDTEANKYAARDANGVALLKQANINTPSLLCKTELIDKSAQADKVAQVLIFEAIVSENNAPAKNVEQIWPTLSQNERLDLAQKLVIEVSKHHNAGLLQTDLYLKNFLVENDKIYTLDGDGIRQFAHLSPKQALQNLATLWSKFDELDIEKWQQSLAKTYVDISILNIVFAPDKLTKLANFHRLKVASHYADKKVFRTCTDVMVKSLRGDFFALNTQFLQTNIESSRDAYDEMIKQSEPLLKNGNSATVAKIDINNQAFVLKRYNIKNAWHGLRRALRPSRAAASWANAYRLQLLGIATAKPVALLETRRFRLRGKAYFISEYIDSPDVAQYFAQIKNKTDRAEAVKNIVTLFYKLYLLQISHGDLKASNIKIQGAQPVLIDLDSMRQHRFGYFAQKAHVRDLNRFMQNWQNQPALYNAFVKTFKVIYDDTTVLQQAGIDQNKEISHKEISE